MHLFNQKFLLSVPDQYKDVTHQISLLLEWWFRVTFHQNLKKVALPQLETLINAFKIFPPVTMTSHGRLFDTTLPGKI